VGSVTVKRGRAKPLWRGHPWVFADSVAKSEGDPRPGDLVTVRDERSKAVGCGFFSPSSRIAVRILSREEHIETDAEFFHERIESALRLRIESLDLPSVTDAYRLVHSEGDFLPGLIVDRFADRLVVQFSTAGMDLRREKILDALEKLLAPVAIYERPDRRACAAEGLAQEPGLLRGSASGPPPVVTEYGILFRVRLQGGQKTGFYADQRENRRRVAALARGKTVLDLYCYTGGFGLHAAANDAATVIGIDSSGPALALAAENAMLNGSGQLRLERADARAFLNEAHRAGRRFGLVVCDPPKLARDRKGVARALKGYRDLHLRAMRVVDAGGLLAVSSCSGAVDESQFENTLREAAYDLGREVQILHRAGQAPDHPVLSTCPEGRYLKFLVARVA
jgi:23S rRNA (cytosine1962-C5)-methyltransferase